MKRNSLPTLLSLLLAAALLLAVLPSCAVAASDYVLIIGDVNVTAGNLSGPGWSFQPSRSTLTLTDFTYRGQGDSGLYEGNITGYTGIYYEGSRVLKIFLKGENRIELDDVSSENSEIDVIRCLAGLEISGSGSLTLQAGSCGQYSIGIWCGGDLTVRGGTVNAAAGKAKYCDGVSCQGAIVMSGGTLTGSASVAHNGSVGIMSGSLLVNGGEIAGGSAGSEKDSLGFFISGDVTVNEGTVNAAAGESVRPTAGDGSCNSCAFAVQGAVTVNGGSLTAVGGEAVSTAGSKGFSTGADVSQGLTVNGGEVTLSAGKANHEAAALCGSLTVNGGTVMAAGGELAGDPVKKNEKDFGSFGIDGDLTVGADKLSLTVFGDTAAVLGKVKTAKKGTGWTDAAGTEGKESVPSGKTGQTLTYRRLKFPAAFSFSTGK